MDEMSANTRTLEPRDVVCNERRWRQHELTRRLRAHSLVRCRVSCALCWSWLSRRHWCWTSYRAVSPRIRNPSFLLDVVVRLFLVIVNSNCSHNYCVLHIAKTGHLMCLSLHLWAQTMGHRLSNQNKSPCSYMAGFVFFTHFWDCSVNTELINRNNCAKNSFNRFEIGTIVYRQFSTAFAFKLTSETMDSWHGRLDVCFRQILTSSSRQFCPIHLMDYLHLWNTTFFLIQDQKMTIVLFQIFLQKEKRVGHLTRILFHCHLIHKRSRCTSTWRWSFL